VTRIRDAAEGIWEFIAGDDWVTAAGVVAALAITALISDADSAWFVMPLAVGVLLTLSIWREARRGRRR
jgi:hypothetical protein